MKRKPYSNCLLLLFQDFFQRFGINQTYSGLTKIRTRRRVADGTDGTEPVRPVLGRLREPFPLGRGGATPYRFLFIRHIVLKHRPEPDIIRPSTSVKIFFFNRSNRYREPKMNPARKKPSLLFSSLLF
ncbi:hypothetical protein AB5X13_002093, partial [Neisseria gonorrhoeae]